MYNNARVLYTYAHLHNGAAHRAAEHKEGITIGTNWWCCLKSCTPLFTGKLCEMTVFLVQRNISIVVGGSSG